MAYKNDLHTKQLFSIIDFLFLGYSCMLAKIGVLRLQARITVSFQYVILCVLTHIQCNSKPTGHTWMFCILNNCSTIRDVYFLV